MQYRVGTWCGTGCGTGCGTVVCGTVVCGTVMRDSDAGQKEGGLCAEVLPIGDSLRVSPFAIRSLLVLTLRAGRIPAQRV